MKSLFTKMLILCIGSFLTFGFMGCEKKGPMEEAGKKIDKAVDSAKEKIEDATE